MALQEGTCACVHTSRCVSNDTVNNLLIIFTTKHISFLFACCSNEIYIKGIIGTYICNVPGSIDSVDNGMIPRGNTSDVCCDLAVNIHKGISSSGDPGHSSSEDLFRDGAMKLLKGVSSSDDPGDLFNGVSASSEPATGCFTFPFDLTCGVITAAVGDTTLGPVFPVDFPGIVIAIGVSDTTGLCLSLFLRDPPSEVSFC